MTPRKEVGCSDRFGRQIAAVLATACLAALTILAAPPPVAIADQQSDATGLMGGGVIGDLDRPEAPVAQAPSKLDLLRPNAAATAVAPVAYPFFPQAGTLWQDLFVNNFVDVGDGVTPRDYDCTGYTYLGHNGHDSNIVGFREQAIGVPVFAALDGTVVAAHDGEFDQNTAAITDNPNFVTIAHANGQQTQYLHFKKNSVSVVVGQAVAAGTQIGLTGSSGLSTWPHLHFGSFQNGVVYEPSAGPCRPGPSYWVSQTPIRRDFYVNSFTFGTSPFSGNAGYPFDQATRVGAFLNGTTTLYFRLSFGNLPVGSSYRTVITRPTGTSALDASSSFANTDFFRTGWYWFVYNVSPLNTLGAWVLHFYVNGTEVVTAPFSVVATSAEIVNHAPLAVSSVALSPTSPSPGDVPFCRVTPTSLYRRDPDYDLVRYRYRWEINGSVVRQVTTAALADAIPKGLLQAGDRLTCTVTPFDDALAGPSASVANQSAPIITSQPGNVSVRSGQTATFTVAAIGTPPPACQWQISTNAAAVWTNLADVPPYSGVTTTTLTVANVASTLNLSRYRCVATNVAGTATSQPAVLIVRSATPGGNFDGDEKAEITLYRPSTGYWYIKQSSTNYTTYLAYQWGLSTDIAVPGDYDGDGRGDLAVYRPSSGYWFILLSSTSYTTYAVYQWGLSADIPGPGDYDGDGRTDLGLYRPSNGYWYILQSSTNYASYIAQQWGLSTDVPVAGDYDGDGRTDLGLYRPSNGFWYILRSSTNYATYIAKQWGLATDVPVPGDYDGDGSTDLGVYRPSAGYWYVLQSSTGYATYLASQWGLSTDVPVPGDYDGDGRTDFGLYRPSAGYWYILQSSTNYTTYIAQQWGVSTDIPILERR
jgi:hypothetical protein